MEMNWTIMKNQEDPLEKIIKTPKVETAGLGFKSYHNNLMRLALVQRC